MSGDITITWGILATGGIAHAFAQGLKSSRTGKLVAVASREQSKADAFAAKFSTAPGQIKAYATYEALLADPQVQAVYIATPHTLHAQWAIAAARAGKHILVEKPLTMSLTEAESIFAAARQHEVFAMEAFMYRCHPQTQRLVELVRSGLIGQVRQIQATFSFLSTAGAESRLVNPQLGGGGILDVGCYTMSMARLIAGVATGQPFAEPLQVLGTGCLEQDGTVDSYAVAVAKFPGDILAQLACGMRLNQENTVCIYGTDGSLLVRDPWVPSRDGGVTEIRVHQGLWPKRSLTERIAHKLDRWFDCHRDEYWTESIRIVSDRSIYAHEADTVAASIAQRQSPAMSWDDSLGNMRALDAWRRSLQP